MKKKVCKFLKSKYASSLSQFYMALVVFCMKFFTLNVSKKLSIHFLSTFYIFKTFSGTRAIQRTLNRVFAMRQTQANVDKSVKNVKFCSYVAYLIAYGAIWCPKYRSDSIRNGKSTPKMYFQAAYMNVNFWKISGNMSPFVKANLAFGLIFFCYNFFVSWGIF